MNESATVSASQANVRVGWERTRWLIRAGMWSLLLAYLFSFFGQRFFVAELLANFRTQFLVLLVVAVQLTKFSRTSWLLLICLLLATAWAGWETGRIYLPASQPPAGKTSLRLMSFNVLATNTEFQAAIEEVRKHDPDVVAVLEYANNWHVAFDHLNETYPYQHRDPRWHGYGIAIFSKLPLENTESVPLTEEEIDNPAAIAKFKFGGQTLRLVAVHVMSPINRYRLDLRNRQFEQIATLVNDESTPTILCGDMNCSPSSRFLSGLIDETALRDSRQGFGVQPSWPDFAFGFGIPIDHVLVSESVHVHDRFLGEFGGSDHCPVIVDVSVEQP
ncbi:endonuclease/exonuclease/phosphatase family protein [Mariniblastus fucicola]|uniref:Endonuclease/exonuclease/phosphatase domain-containing protein n=1 Tax=Mariniblastus fucicola TaxID=980251 RepID=A0A5B9P8K9_9BACT|nr:endonuclease/exonuclease/phosphatase family protein [Mariniblastus fucicola]QEG21545.1 hypothetical protein MFFC18_14020 [Mariniblastus fucicola]